MTTIEKGTKLDLNINGKVKTYEVKWIENGFYSIYNKYEVTKKVSLDFILNNINN